MKDLFQNDASLDPFYVDQVIVSGQRGTRKIRGTFDACVLDNGFADVMTDVGTASEVRTINVMLRNRDFKGTCAERGVPTRDVACWSFATPPRKGDSIIYQGDSFRVSTVARTVDGFTLVCKEA